MQQLTLQVTHTRHCRQLVTPKGSHWCNVGATLAGHRHSAQMLVLKQLVLLQGSDKALGEMQLHP